MTHLAREDLMSLEQYAQERSEFRTKVISHKVPRKIALGPNANLYFEDKLTMQYQIQEMLRIEKIFEAEGIQEELDAYNPLIPDGSNWKATFMIEFPNEAERKVQLAKLIGIEKKTWVQVADMGKVYAIANEDLERETEEKTSAVHFMRFELSPDMVMAARDGSVLKMGIDHPAYSCEVELEEASRQSLAGDLA